MIEFNLKWELISVRQLKFRYLQNHILYSLYELSPVSPHEYVIYAAYIQESINASDKTQPSQMQTTQTKIVYF